MFKNERIRFIFETARRSGAKNLAPGIQGTTSFISNLNVDNTRIQSFDHDLYSKQSSPLD